MIKVTQYQSEVLYDSFRLNFYLHNGLGLLVEDRRNNFVKRAYIYHEIEPNIKAIIINTPLSKRYD